VVGEFERRVQLHDRHVTAYAVSAAPLVFMLEGGWGRVTPGASSVIEGVVVTHSVPVGRVAGGAGEFGRSEAAAFDKTERLKAHIFELRIVYRRRDPMTRAAELNLTKSR
jgi:hypothetical protein